MKFIFVGAQASGKGTQGEIIAKKLNIIHISMGEVLREIKDSPLKKQIDSLINKGNLVSDKLTIKILLQRLKEKDAKKGFILDGFPRNLEQAKMFDKLVKIDKVIEIAISDKETFERIFYRLSCPKDGTVFNTKTNPPKKDSLCDICGTKLVKRADDNEETIKKRLKIYHEETEPILKFYKNKVVKIDGKQLIPKVTRDILKVLGK